MITVGVRELRQRASELLRLVEAGHTVRITDRRRPVAVLAPLSATTPLEDLRSQGRLHPATPHRSLPDPLPPTPHTRMPSQVLEDLRHDER